MQALTLDQIERILEICDQDGLVVFEAGDSPGGFEVIEQGQGLTLHREWKDITVGKFLEVVQEATHKHFTKLDKTIYFSNPYTKIHVGHLKLVKVVKTSIGAKLELGK